MYNFILFHIGIWKLDDDKSEDLMQDQAGIGNSKEIWS